MPWLCGTLSQKQRKEFFQLYPEDINMIYVLLEQCYSFQVNTPDRRKKKKENVCDSLKDINWADLT